MADIPAGEDIGVTTTPAVLSAPGAEPVKLVIFDCDGVLVDSEPLAIRVLLDVLNESGLSLTFDEAIELFLGRSMQSISRMLKLKFDFDFNQGALETARLRLYELFRTDLKPIKNIAATIDALDTKVCVASSSQPERIELALSAVDLHKRLHPNLFSATMVENGKPAPDLFLHAAAQMGVEPRNCVVVEDSTAGIEAARKAGMRVLAFIGGSHARSDAHRASIAATGADRMFENMHELRDILVEISPPEI